MELYDLKNGSVISQSDWEDLYNKEEIRNCFQIHTYKMEDGLVRTVIKRTYEMKYSEHFKRMIPQQTNINESFDFFVGFNFYDFSSDSCISPLRKKMFLLSLSRK